MKTSKLLRISIFISILIGVSSSQLSAQVASPSLNYLSLPVMPAASGWSKSDFIAGEYTDGTGEKSFNGEAAEDLTLSTATGVAGFSFDALDIDAYILTTDFGNSTDSSTDTTGEGYYLDTITENYAAIALRGQGNVIVGFAMHNTEADIYFAQPDYQLETFKLSGIIGSFSVKLMESMFLGLGVERVSESSTLTVNNEWNNITGGLALWFGQQSDTQFRIEMSVTQSPESKMEAESNDTKYSARHQKSSTSRINVELMMNGLLFSYANKYIKENREPEENNPDDDVDVTEETTNEGSVQWIPSEGMFLGFSFQSYEYKSITTDKIDSFKINLGYVF